MRALMAVLNLIGKADRDGLRCHLTDQQQQRDHDQDIDPADVLAMEDQQQDAGHIDRRGNIDQFVAAQNGDDQTTRFVQHRVDAL